MWHLLTIVMADLTTGSYLRRSCCMALYLSSCLSVGLLGASLTQTIATKLKTPSAPTAASGSASATLMIKPFDAPPNWNGSEKMWTTKKSASAPSNIEATNGN